MTRLLLSLLETWTGERYVPVTAVLDAAPAGSDCGRLIRQWVIETRTGA
jgi:hypothetical protein